jgi:hypothetical protein
VYACDGADHAQGLSCRFLSVVAHRRVAPVTVCSPCPPSQHSPHQRVVQLDVLSVGWCLRRPGRPSTIRQMDGPRRLFVLVRDGWFTSGFVDRKHDTWACARRQAQGEKSNVWHSGDSCLHPPTYPPTNLVYLATPLPTVRPAGWYSFQAPLESCVGWRIRGTRCGCGVGMDLFVSW